MQVIYSKIKPTVLMVKSKDWANQKVENGLDGFEHGNQYGVETHTEETKKKISDSKKGIPRPKHVIEAMHKGLKEKGRPPEQNARRSATLSKMKWYNNGIKNLRLKEHESVPPGFVKGRKPFPSRWSKK